MPAGGPLPAAQRLARGDPADGSGLRNPRGEFRLPWHVVCRTVLAKCERHLAKWTQIWAPSWESLRGQVASTVGLSGNRFLCCHSLFHYRCIRKCQPKWQYFLRIVLRIPALSLPFPLSIIAGPLTSLLSFVFTLLQVEPGLHKDRLMSIDDFRSMVRRELRR